MCIVCFKFGVKSIKIRKVNFFGIRIVIKNFLVNILRFLWFYWLKIENVVKSGFLIKKCFFIFY